MGICYGRIGLVLWGQGPQDENVNQDLALQRKLVAKRNVVKMFIVLVIIFCVCWLPYHAYFIYTYHDKEVVMEPYIQHVYLAFYFLAMANAMINPLIYYAMNARYLNIEKKSDQDVRAILQVPWILSSPDVVNPSVVLRTRPISRAHRLQIFFGYWSPTDGWRSGENGNAPLHQSGAC